MTDPAPPLPTFVPQDAWLRLTLGQITVSMAVSVPDKSFLLADGLKDGLVGPADGVIAYLAGAFQKLDGGQKWVIWDATSLAVSDGINVFCPYVDPSIPGRWKSTDKLNQSNAGGVVLTSGPSITVLPSTVQIYFIIINKTVGSPTIVRMPTLPLLWQQFVVKDGKGDAATNPITIDFVSHGNTCDGADTQVIAADFASMSLVWDGTEYRQM